MLFQFPNKGGRSRQGLPVRAIHSTASTNRRLFLPLRPGSPGLPRQRGSIFAHWASVKRNLSIQSLNHSQAWMGIPESQQALGAGSLKHTLAGEVYPDHLVRLRSKPHLQPPFHPELVQREPVHASLLRPRGVARRTGLMEPRRALLTTGAERSVPEIAQRSPKAASAALRAGSGFLNR